MQMLYNHFLVYFSQILTANFCSKERYFSEQHLVIAYAAIVSILVE